MKLVIDRSKWYRGKNEASLRRSNDGQMCCLGFLGLACGLSEDEITDHADPSYVVSEKWPAWLSVLEPDWNYGTVSRMHDTKVCGDLIKVNDGPGITEQERECTIAELMGAHGVEVFFVDGVTE